MKKIKLILSVFFGTLFAFLIISCGEKPHVHNLIEHERKEATCENDGYEAYVECTDCDYTTYKVIKAKGHDFDSNYLYNATKHYHKCKKCDAIKDEDNHNFAWIIDKYATEDEIGIKHEKCNICEYTRNENTIIDKLTHTHNMLHVVKVDKTCTKDGNIEYYHCSKCEKNYLDKNGDNEVVDVVIKASHEYGDYHEEINATCSKEGTKGHYECSVCHTYFDANKNKLNSLIIEKKSHDYKWVIDKPATEEEFGLKHEECNVCHYTRNENTIIVKLNHTHNMEHVLKIDKTCTKDGNIEYYHCSKCNKNYLDKNGVNEVIDVVIKASHEYGDFINEVASTCSKEGAKGHYECGECHSYFDASKNKLGSIVIAKKDHDLVHHEKFESTCSSIGYEAYDTCKNCDYTTYKVIEKKPHEYKWVIDKPATEDETGLKHEECNVCHYTRNKNTIIDKLAHIHNMKHITKVDKTCTSDGNIEYYHCSKCNKNYLDKNGVNEVIDVVIKASHEYGSFINEVDSTCTNEGTKGHYECSACHNYFDANKNKLDGLVIAKKAHVYKNEWSHDESTHYHECKVCNNKKEISSHNYITNYEGYDKCSICDYEDKRCKVYFDVDGGEQITTQKYEYKTIIYLPVPKKNGYDFVGWEYNDRLCNKIEVNKNITLKAIWTKDFEFKLLDDGTIEIIKYTGNDKIVELPKHTTIIGNYAFRGCSSLKKVKILEGCTSIDSSAFEGCSSLKEVKILEGCTSIGESAFSGCSGLTSIEIPNSVTNMGIYAFYDCSSLTSITLPFVGESKESNTYICYIFGGKNYLDNDKYVPNSLKKVIILTTIGKYAFYGCKNLTSIEIPTNVTSIEKLAFSGCSGLTSIEIPNSVTSIGDNAINSERDFRKTQQKISNNIENSLQMIA